jgi:hypothetical protein
MEVAGWFHGVISSNNSQSQMYNIKADGFWRKRNLLGVTKIANSRSKKMRIECLNPAGQHYCDVIRLLG